MAGQFIPFISLEDTVNFFRDMLQIKRALLGSVSDYVVRNALLPVVIVPSYKKRVRTISK